MNNYRVNINDLLDLDEEFLFENESFRSLIKKVHDDFEYLVNPIFDVSEVIQTAKPSTPKDPTQGWEVKMSQGDIIPLFQQTFNAPSMRNRLVFDKMVAKYDALFADEKAKAEKRLSALVEGRQVHDLIKQVLDFYDAKERSKPHQHLLDEEARRMLKDTKKQLDGFVDGLIDTLHTEFGDQSISPHASRKEKLAYLRRLAVELDREVYSDLEKFFSMIRDHQNEFLKTNIGGTNEPFVPKTKITFHEYTAIKNYFNGADFERNSFMTLGLPLVSSVLWFMQGLSAE